jgi:hypothetical protein
MKGRPPSRPLPPHGTARGALPARTDHTTVSKRRLPKPRKQAKPPARAAGLTRTVTPPHPPKRHVAHIVDREESSLLDLIDNLLAKGVMLNADLILALANVDLVYLRLSALLCAADRVLPIPPLPPRAR